MVEEQPPATEPVKEDLSEDMDLDLITKADKAAERIENAIVNLNKTIDRQHQFMAQMKIGKILDGKSSANNQPPEESPVEYAQKVMANETETKP